MDTQDLIDQINDAAIKFAKTRYYHSSLPDSILDVIKSAMLEGALIYAKLDKEDCQIDLQLLKASMQ